MVARRHKLHEIFAHHVGIFAFQGAFHVGIYHALCGDGILDIVIYKLGVVLRTHACERLALRLRNTEPLKGFLDVVRHIFPVVAHFCVGADIGRDMSHIQAIDGGTPIGNFHFVINLEGFETELLHPYRVVLFFGELFHYLRCQTGFHAVCVVLLVTDIVDTAVHILHIGFFFLFCHARNLPIQTSFRLPKPCSLISSISPASPLRTMTPSSIT